MVVCIKGMDLTQTQKVLRITHVCRVRVTVQYFANIINMLVTSNISKVKIITSENMNSLNNACPREYPFSTDGASYLLQKKGKLRLHSSRVLLSSC